MELQIGKWGNSLAMRLPASLARDLGLTEGASVSTQELGQRLLSVGDSVHADQMTVRRQLVEQIRQMHKTMPMTRPITKDEMSRY